MSTDRAIERAAEILAEASNAVASSGAGVSAESNIATFRDPGGIWDRLNPAEVGTAEGLLHTLTHNAKALVPMFIELLDAFAAAEPNPGHIALSDLEKMGILHTVITQNIDNLHQEAGNTKVVEVHGNGFRLVCLACHHRCDRKRRELIGETKEKLSALTDHSLERLMTVMPQCERCGAVMRPDVVMFGEAVQGLPEAFSAARNCDVLLAVGTSGVVYPAAYLPFEAKKEGARVIVINPNENAFAGVSDVYIPLPSGQALPRIVQIIKTAKGLH